MKRIKELHKNDKHREKLVAKGVQALKNDELLAILLGSGVYRSLRGLKRFLN